MKKGIIKLLVFALVFVASLFIIGRLMNQGHDNLTVKMAQATLPLMSMENEGITYNQLQGYTCAMDVAFQRETVTVLGQNRDTGFLVECFGQKISGISIEVRNMDGSRLIEKTEIQDYETTSDKIRGRVYLKDLIEPDTDYSLAFLLTLENGQEVYYYTRVIWSENLHQVEKIQYAEDFHEKLYDKEAARELTKYLETNGKLEDNSSFHQVNIHSSFKQITWGDLKVKEVVKPVVNLTEIAGQTASMELKYVVATHEGKTDTLYTVVEHFRVRYSTDRMYLLDYQRTMTQIPSVERMYGNDKILLGITETDVPMMESGDGNIVVFEIANRLFSYDAGSNKLAVIFSFYEEGTLDRRTLNDEHDIRILDVDEGGNVVFAVCGYMNRGRYEGQVGLQIYLYNSSLNTIEELIYIPCRETYSVLAAEIDKLLYINRESKLFLQMKNGIYGVDLMERTWEQQVGLEGDDSLHISENQRIAVWSEENGGNYGNRLYIRNFSLESSGEVRVAAGEAIKPLGFMGEDIIYGIAKVEDIVRMNTGKTVFPMYKICICNSSGSVLKEYHQEDLYVTECTIEDNQIILERVKKQENGSFLEADRDYIMNNQEVEPGKNVIVTADIEVYERYVQIQTRHTIDSKSIKILTPKEVVFEGGRELQISYEEERARYYVYGPYGVEEIFLSPADAVALAYKISGVVVNRLGESVWIKGNRVTKNQIMAIKEATVTEQKNSLAVCLDTIFKYEGLVRNSEYFLNRGQSVMEIMKENLPDAEILDMEGCNLDSMLYYVNRDIPVLALLDDGEAVLVTGFNEFNVVIMEPATGKLYKKGINDSAEWFEQNGNCFITYYRE